MIEAYWYAPFAGVLFLILIAYYRGWRKMRLAPVTLATYTRLLLFLEGLLFVVLATVWPLPDSSQTLLTFRAMQKILTCMLAPPLLWLACPLHIIAWGLPARLRRVMVRLRRPGNGGWQQFTRFMTKPATAWLVFISAFTLWHDPAIADFTLQNQLAHFLAPVLLLMISMLFWWHIVTTGPRIHKQLPAWVLVVYLLGAEIPNMAAGVSIAYSSSPLYPHYVSARATLSAADPYTVSVLEDQMIAGALVWVCGSLIYVSTIVAILRRLFYSEGSSVPQPAPNWDANEKFVAPGLEHRVLENRVGENPHYDTRS